MSPFQFWFQPVEDVCCSIIFQHIKKTQMLPLFQKHILKYGAQICVLNPLNGYQNSKAFKFIYRFIRR